MAASASPISARNQAKARIVYDSLATAAPTRLAYVLPTAVRSHAGTPRAADRHLVRPGRGPDPAVRAAGNPASALWQSLSRDRRSEEHTSELQSRLHLVCRLLLETK